MFSTRPRRVSLVRWMVSILILIPILTVWSFFLTGHWQSFKVISASMDPTLRVGDCLIMREQHDFPNLDDMIVVLRDPLGGSFPIVKRVVAGGSSRVRIANGLVYLDGSRKPERNERVADSPNRTWNLKEDEIFVMGDNTNNSQDSTDFGPVARTDVIGVITWRYWPMDRMGKVE